MEFDERSDKKVNILDQVLVSAMDKAVGDFKLKPRSYESDDFINIHYGNSKSSTLRLICSSISSVRGAL